MKNTAGCIPVSDRLLHLVVAWTCAVVLGCAAPRPGAAQAEGWRANYAAADAAREEGDNATYAREMSAAVAGMPAGHLNRPFAQYHAARAYGLLGEGVEAARFLQMAWEEDIEALMISFAEYDPSFDAVRTAPAFIQVMGRPAEMEVTVTHLSGAVHLIDGAGSKVVASVGEEGVLLVDTGYRAALPALRRALASLGSSRVDRLILTHPHEDHWGMAPDLGTEADIVAHAGTAAAMAEPYTFIEGVVLDPKPAEALPDVEVSDQTTISFNGEDVILFDVGAHTGADLAVYFTGSGVLHMGDAYLGGNPMMFPGAADPDGFLNRLEGELSRMGEGTVVVGGHDAPTGLQALRDQISETRACMALVRRALANGKTIEETAESAEGRFAPQWVGYFYRLFAQD